MFSHVALSLPFKYVSLQKNHTCSYPCCSISMIFFRYTCSPFEKTASILGHCNLIALKIPQHFFSRAFCACEIIVGGASPKSSFGGFEMREVCVTIFSKFSHEPLNIHWVFLCHRNNNDHRYGTSRPPLYNTRLKNSSHNAICRLSLCSTTKFMLMLYVVGNLYR